MIDDKASIVENALLEASLKRIRLIEAMDYSDISTDEDYDNKIYKLIYEQAKERKHFPKKIAIILVATLTICFLIMFSVSAQVRTAVVDFFVEVYESVTSVFIKKEDAKGNPDTIETKYEPTYFKENEYIQIDKSTSSLKLFTIWSKNDFFIHFSQHTIKNSNIMLDTEDASYEIKYIGEQKVYYKIKNDTHTALWIAHGYAFILSAYEDLSWEEIEKIVSSLEPVTE